MPPQPEVGLFVDLDYHRHAAAAGREPSCESLMRKARQYGPVAVACAYADFRSRPPDLQRHVEVAGLVPRDVTGRRGDRGSAASIAMAIDVIECLLDRPNVDTLVLVTSEPAFVRLISRARHRFGKQVVLSGARGAVPDDLIDSADAFDAVEHGADPPQDAAAPGESDLRLLQLVVWLAQNRPYMTFGFIRSHALSPHHGLDMDEETVTEALSGLKDRGVLIEGSRSADDGRVLRVLTLDEDHPEVAAVRLGEMPRFEGGRAAAISSTQTE